VAIIEAYSHATTVDQRGAVMLGDEMIDEASRKMAEAIVARGKAAGLALNTSAGSGKTRNEEKERIRTV